MIYQIFLVDSKYRRTLYQTLDGDGSTLDSVADHAREIQENVFMGFVDVEAREAPDNPTSAADLGRRVVEVTASSLWIDYSPPPIA